MRIIDVFTYITLFNLPGAVNSATPPTTGGGSKGKRDAGRLRKGAGAKGKDAKAAEGKGGKGVARPRMVQPQTFLTFDDLSTGMKSERIGEYGGYVIEMPSSTNVLRVRSVWGDKCTDYYAGLEDRRVADRAFIRPALKRLKYSVCEEPLKAYSFEEYYDLRNVDYRPNKSTGIQSLVCTFNPRDPEIKRTITVARSSKYTGFDFFRDMKKRIKPGAPDAAKQQLECLSMLDQFIRIQNELAERYEVETGADISKLKLPEIAGMSVEAAARKEAREANTDETGSLGAGYIVLIIFGVLVALGGGYYGFTKCSSKGKETSTDEDRGEKRKRRSDKNRIPQDALTTVQVVGRPVPI